ncbi:MAG: aldo/keto reductase [Candidatus Aenigmarchaeota archaeon]|nr:aldo/keto reductase [Candidatus Aenigmarchaeota archaeon]
MNYRPLGSTGINVSEVGMGCWAIGGSSYGNSYGPTDDAESIRAVKKAVELGCNFFDTADVYGHGHSEELLGLALRSYRGEVFIATKGGGAYMYNDERWGHVNFSGDYIRFALEQSLRRLKTHYIDVYQLHNPSLKVIKEGEVFRTLRALQKEGKIKHVGVSVHTLEEGIAALDHVDSVQCVFNILDPRNYEMMEAAKRRKIAVVVREPLVNGFATGKYRGDSSFAGEDIRSRMPREYIENLAELMEEVRKRFSHRKESLAQIALKYVLSFDSVSTVIPGAKTERHVAENIGASGIPGLTEEELKVFGS